MSPAGRLLESHTLIGKNIESSGKSLKQTVMRIGVEESPLLTFEAKNSLNRNFIPGG